MDELMRRHLELVIEANKTTNITRISAFDEGITLHIEDSLSALPEINDAPEGKYIDLGSGAGYPGIPLAIATKRDTLLIDSVKKKVDLLDSFIGELDLDYVHTYHGRIEDLGREKPTTFAVATARALSQLSVLLELASPLLIKHGRLVCYKARLSDEELNHSLEVQDNLGMKLVSDRTFRLGEYDRRILCFEKIHNPKIKLPRKTGLAQKSPL